MTRHNRQNSAELLVPATGSGTPRPVPSERTISNLLSKHYPRRKR